MYSDQLESVKDPKPNIFSYILKASKESDDTKARIEEYYESRRKYLRGFRDAVLKDFTENREHDRKVKKRLVMITLAFLVLMFMAAIFTIVISILNPGSTALLSEVFKGSVVGIIISGAVSLSVIIYKYTFNRTDDVFYKYSVNLYKHIVKERGGKQEFDDEEDE